MYSNYFKFQTEYEIIIDKKKLWNFYLNLRFIIKLFIFL